MAKKGTRSFRQPSVAIVIVAGTLTVVFLVAIGRELFQGHQVRTQVKRLRDQIATEQSRQQQLRDLLTYLQSPTFQERQARLELGLKKDGERVVVVPPASGQGDGNTNSTVTDGETSPAASVSAPMRWLNFFLHKK